MNLKISPAVTLIELIIAIVLLSVVVLGFSSLDLFSRYHVLTADRRAKAQNEVSLALEHMTKQISRAIGNISINSIIDPVDSAGGDNIIQAYIDANATGGPGNGVRTEVLPDRWIGYRLNGNQIQYCSQCTDATCTACALGLVWEPVADNITGLTSTGLPAVPAENNITVTVTGCWNAGAAVSSDNPEVTMRTRIKMPSVSTN